MITCESVTARGKTGKTPYKIRMCVPDKFILEAKPRRCLKQPIIQYTSETLTAICLFFLAFFILSVCFVNNGRSSLIVFPPLFLYRKDSSHVIKDNSCLQSLRMNPTIPRGFLSPHRPYPYSPYHWELGEKRTHTYRAWA